MSNDDLEKSLNAAMGDLPPQEQPATDTTPPPVAQEKPRSKASLRTPPVVAPKTISEPVPESFEEMKLRAKLEAYKELLAEQMAVKKEGKAIAQKLIDDAPPEELIEFTVNLPVQASNIRLDGREYYHGHTYKIRESQLTTFRDIQSQAWRHDDQVRGYRPHAAGVSTSGVTINRDGQAMSRPIY